MTADERVVRGLRAQAERRRELLEAGAEPVGWKIGFNLAPVRERLGLDAPVIGFLTSAGVLASGDSHPAGGVAECEVAIHVGEDVEPGASPERAAGAIAGLGAAIELVDPIDLDAGLEAILAGNIFHRAVAFGEPVAGAELGGVRSRVLVDGEERGASDALAATGDPGAIVAHVASLAGLAGDRLRAGERIIAGIIQPFVPTAPGNLVEHDLGALGSVAVRFT